LKRYPNYTSINTTRAQGPLLDTAAKLKDEEWLAFVEDPAWLPHDYDRRNDSLVFAYLERDAQRRATYLDPRFLAQAPKSQPAPVSELPLDAIAASARPMHFIFHTSFCCSTLMARALDIPGASMGLKEPAVLLSFADSWANGRRSPGGATAFNATLNLLSRPLSPGETNVVKPVNIVNYIIPAFMNWRSDAKAIVMHSSLDAFLRAIARRGLEGRNFARGVFHQLSTVIPLDHDMSPQDIVRMSDLQVAAQAWLMQAAFITSVTKLFGPSRIRLLSGDRFLEDTRGSLAGLSDFFGLSLSETQIGQVVDGPVFKEHSKQPLIAFDAAAQKAQFEKAGEQHFEEINAVRAWARRFAARLDLPTELNDTL
jgi:hypothetical protein